MCRERVSPSCATAVFYILLGQIIEALSGRTYEAACDERVLARAGIKKASLDQEWGGIFQSAGGWALSGPEYLSFARLLQSNELGLLGPEASEFLRSTEGKWINPQRAMAYSLGVFVHPTGAGGLPNISSMQGATIGARKTPRAVQLT